MIKLATYAAQRLLAPMPHYWLGTDSYGRDILSRLIYPGTRPMFRFGGPCCLDNTTIRAIYWHFIRLLRRLDRADFNAFYRHHYVYSPP